jgi:hypothetical protein
MWQIAALSVTMQRHFEFCPLTNLDANGFLKKVD